jgi:hypothetical protein
MGKSVRWRKPWRLIPFAATQGEFSADATQGRPPRRRDAGCRYPGLCDLIRPLTMPHALLTAAVRQRVATTFANLGIADSSEFRESLLIRGGAYVGRRFQAAAGHAVWFVEEDQIKFYGADGKLAAVTEVEAPLERMAA